MSNSLAFFPLSLKPLSSWNVQTNGFVTQVCDSVSFTLYSIHFLIIPFNLEGLFVDLLLSNFHLSIKQSLIKRYSVGLLDLQTFCHIGIHFHMLSSTDE